MDEQFLTKTKFASMVETEVMDKKVSYMDAVIGVCDENGIDLEDARKFINIALKDKIEAEAMRLNYLPQVNTLPID